LGKLTKKLGALTRDAFIKVTKRLRNSLINSLQKEWYDTVYKRLSLQYTSAGRRNSAGGVIYPFMRTRTLRESLKLLKPKGRYTFTKDKYQYDFKIIGQLGPAVKNGFDYSDYLDKNTIVKGYRTHAFKSLEVIIQRSLNNITGR